MDLTGGLDDLRRRKPIVKNEPHAWPGNSGMAAGLLIALRPKMQSPAIARVAKELALRVLESSVHPDALHASGMSRVIAHTLSLALVPSGDGVVDTTRITCGTSYNPVPTYTADTVPVHGYYLGVRGIILNGHLWQRAGLVLGSSDPRATMDNGSLSILKRTSQQTPLPGTQNFSLRAAVFDGRLSC